VNAQAARPGGRFLMCERIAGMPALERVQAEAAGRPAPASAPLEAAGRPGQAKAPLIDFLSPEKIIELAVWMEERRKKGMPHAVTSNA